MAYKPNHAATNRQTSVQPWIYIRSYRTNHTMRDFAKFAIIAVGMAVAFATMFECLHAQDANTPEGSSSRESRETALRSIPLKTLTPEAVAKLRPVLEDPSIFRRMPNQTITCDQDLFNFLVRYPETLIEIWELMGMTKVDVQRTGPYTFQGDDGSGTRCKSELVMGSDRTHIYYATGDYEGPFIARKLHGRCVCVIYSNSQPSESGQNLLTAQMDVFLKLDNLGADLAAKTLSPLVVRTADFNYAESLRFISQLSSAAQRNPGGMEMLAGKMKKVKPEVRERFVEVTKQAADRRSRLIESKAVSREESESNSNATTIGATLSTTVPPITIKK